MTVLTVSVSEFGWVLSGLQGRWIKLESGVAATEIKLGNDFDQRSNERNKVTKI